MTEVVHLKRDFLLLLRHLLQGVVADVLAKYAMVGTHSEQNAPTTVVEHRAEGLSRSAPFAGGALEFEGLRLAGGSPSVDMLDREGHEEAAFDAPGLSREIG